MDTTQAQWLDKVNDMRRQLREARSMRIEMAQTIRSLEARIEELTR